MKLWQFMETRDPGSAAWTWRVVGTSTGIETAAHPHPNYGAAVTDAIRHGFVPGNDQWVVVTPAGITRFEPAEKTAIRPELDGIQPVRSAADGKGTGV
jgi:hypothetical protein